MLSNISNCFIVFRYDTSNGDPCNGMKSPKKKNISVRTLTVAIVTPVVAVLLVSAVLILCFCKKKRKQNVTEGIQKVLAMFTYIHVCYLY
jgi:flagellar basal body-associated protein FliL